MWQSFKELLGQFYIPTINIIDTIEIFIISIIVYYIIKYVKGTRMWTVLKGIALLGIAYIIAYICSFNAILLVFQSITFILTVAIVTVFQPEIRKFLENIGSKHYKPAISLKRKNVVIENKISDKTIDSIVSACKALSKTKTGALIVIEDNIPLNDFVETGIELNSTVSSQLLVNIFEKNTPLHDGAVIIQDNKVSSATCYLPLSENNNINKKLGTRHRAALGMSETTDALVVTVSEETGNISISQKGTIKQKLSEETLRNSLIKFNEENSTIKKTSIRDLLLNNMRSKFFAILFSLFIWIILINASNPIVTKTFDDIPITVINESAIIEIDKTYTFKSDDFVDVTVKGDRRNIENLTTEDIKVIADFNKLSDVYSINLYGEIEKMPKATVILSENTAQVLLEDLVETEYNIQINKVGTPAENCYVQAIEPETETISIKGPQSIMKIIDKVSIDVDINKLSQSTHFVSTPVIYDKNGSVIKNDKLLLNYKTVSGSVKTLNTKIVPIKFNLKPQDMLTESIIKSFVADADTIAIAGTDDKLAEINSIEVDVPINIDESQIATDNFSKNIKVADYFKSENIYIAKDGLSINLAINFNETIKKELLIDTSKITVKNLNKNYNIKFTENKLKVVISGNKNDVIKVTPQNILASIDLNGMYGGNRTVSVKFENINGIKIDNTSIAVSLIWK